MAQWLDSRISAVSRSDARSVPLASVAAYFRNRAQNSKIESGLAGSANQPFAAVAWPGSARSKTGCSSGCGW